MMQHSCNKLADVGDPLRLAEFSGSFATFCAGVGVCLRRSALMEAD